MPSVALICTANRCRSVMAHAILLAELKKRSLDVDVYSAGVMDFSDAPPIDDTTATCLKHDTPSPKETPTWIGDLPLDSITRFLVMERYHADALVHEFGISRDRISLLGHFDPHRRGLEIADPYSRSRVVYDDSYNQIRDCLVGYLETTSDLRAS
ncbi:MAG TPA: hypothetical protein VGW36_03240 [Pyrinomonadaceae bacterium]|nr:hypothetical protein [Pyrinomonadaceae bacterium]